ncbi:hypothetical protein [Flavobacterium sp.]|uniref:hypothetical protein n=1 Tax=Flavobacterium sp. TaxID=239 RepID=UPI00263051B0|nr:hypothetical protein [Flavobacterium sp.]
MGILIGIIVRFITFPGVVLDLIVNFLIAKLLKLEIIRINLLSILTGNPIVIKEESRYYKILLFSILPFIIMTLIAIPFCYKAIEFNQGKKFLICLWLGISIAAHSFPEIEIGKLIWKRTNEEIKNKNYITVLIYPYVIFIFIFRILHVLWLDILYGVGILFLIDYYCFK